MDASYNLIKELPPEIQYLVYLNEFNISNNLITTIPEEICDLLSLLENEQGLDLTGLHVTNIPEEVLKNGITGIREHYKWNKPLPRQRGSHGKAIEMMSPRAAHNTYKKQLSVRDKRCMFKEREF